MKNIEKYCEILSEPRSKFKDAIMKIPGTTKDYLEFYSLVPVHYDWTYWSDSLYPVCRGSINRKLCKNTSTLCYCTSFVPSRKGGIGATVLTVLPPSLPSRWIKSPGGSQIKSIKSFSRIYLEKNLVRFHSADARQIWKNNNNTVYWHPYSTNE